jgi:hypothetical protein
LIGGGKKATTTLGHAALPLSFGVLATASGVAAMVTGDLPPLLWLLPAAGLAGALPLALASVRTSEEDRDAARLAGARALVGTCALLATLCVVGAFQALVEHQVFEAIAMAGADTRSMLVAATRYGSRPEWLVSVPALIALAAIASVVPVSQHLREARAVVGAVAAVIAIGLPVTAYYVMSTQLAALEQGIWGGDLVYAMAERVGDLPRPQRSDGLAIDAHWPPRGTCLVEEGSKGWRVVRREHGPTSCPAAPAPAPTPLDPGVEPLVVVKAETPARRLAEAQWFPGAGTLHILTEEPADQGDLPGPLDRTRLGTIAIGWSPLEQALDAGATWLLHDTSGGTLAGSADALAPLPGGVSAASSLETLPVGIRQVILIPDKRWTVQDVLSLCAAAVPERGHEPERRCVLASATQWEERMARLAAPPPRRVRGVVTERAPVEFEPAEVREGGFLGVRSEGDLGIDGTLRTEMDPALSRDEIDAVIQRNQTHIRYCYQRELGTQPRLRGKVTVRLVITRDGTVSSASIESSTLNHAEVESCVTEKLMRLKFPEPRGGNIVVVSYPFIFSQE